jgi:DHA2 family multidrug resistance protein
MRGLAALDAEVTRQAATIGYLNDFRLMMYMMLGSIPLLLLLRGSRRPPPVEAATME